MHFRKMQLDAVVGPLLAEAGVELARLPTQRAGHAEELARTADLAGADLS